MIPSTQDSPQPQLWQMRRMGLATLVLMAGFGAVVWRLHSVQIKEHEMWAERSEGMLKQKRELPAMRGAIRDSNGEMLAQDKLVHDIWVNTQQLRDINDVSIRLARLTNSSVKKLSAQMTPDQIIRQYRQHVATVLVKGLNEPIGTEDERVSQMERLLTEERRVEFPLLKGVQDNEAAEWKRSLDSNHIGAVGIRPVVKRFYPCAERLTHVLGFVNQELVKEPDDENPLRLREKYVQVGRQGIEAIFNEQLSGKDGYQWIEKDRKGREIPAFRGQSKPARNGQDVTLTIDMHLQDITEQVIEQAYAYHTPRRIMALLVEPKSGAILSMASRPHFQRDTMKGTMSNLAIDGEYEPGSVFKVVTYAAAFDAKVSYLSEMLNCDPDQKIFSKVGISDHFSGQATAAQAFAQSSNRAAYLMASRLGEKRFLDAVSRFGFGQPTGIALTGESSGRVHKAHGRNWDGKTFSRMAMGHALMVTPVQMCMAVGSIANGGSLMKPQIIKEIRDEDGKVLQSFSPQEVRRVCSPKTSEAMKQAMIGVVELEKGTGARAAIPGVTVAGKTGTSQLYTEDGRGIWQGHYCVSFAGFAPAEDPQLCAIIVVDDPKGDASDLMGGKLAAPIFAQLMKQCLHTMAVANAGTATKTPLMKGGAE